MKGRPTASWRIELWAVCPKCGEDVDLLTADDFWDGRYLDIGEHMTDRSLGVEVVCPEGGCAHAFAVDLEY